MASAQSQEEDVVGVLLSGSREFSAFYRAERSRITGDIRWLEDPGLKPAATVYRPTDGTPPIITLRKIPVPLEDVGIVAEELEHLILDLDGFPTTQPHISSPAVYDMLSTAINSMVHDPVIDERLARYGFDVWNIRTREIEEAIRGIKGVRKPPSNKNNPAWLVWVVNYASIINDLEVASRLAGPTGAPTAADFQRWFESRFPEIARASRTLVDLVRRIGYDTPQKTERLLNEILQSYGLAGVLRVGSNPTFPATPS